MLLLAAVFCGTAIIFAARWRWVQLAERRQLQAESRFAALFEGAQNPLCLLATDGTILRMNQRAATVFAEDETDTDYIGQPFAVLPVWQSEQRQLVADTLESAAEGEVVHHDLNRRHDDGWLQYLHVSVGLC